MHVAFIPVGKRSEVELLLRDMESHKYLMPLKKGKANKKLIIPGSIRCLPLGFYDYIFPKEYLDAVLNTLKFNDEGDKRYSVGIIKKAFIRKMLGVKKAPKNFNIKTRYPWIIENVNIVPIGIKEDGVITDPNGEHKGWSHESI